MSDLVTTTEKTYPDLVYSNFPDNYDKAIVFRDPSASESAVIQQYRSLYEAGQVAAAVDLLSKNPSLNDCIINAAKLLRLQDSVRAVQRYYFDDVQEKIFRLGNLKGVWNVNMSTDATGENHLQKFDVVTYIVDGFMQYFLVYGDVTAGMVPTENPDVYLQMSMKGEKGDQGYTPINGIDYFDGYTPVKGIDYYDGVNGLGLSPCGGWVSNRGYQQYSLVSHNGKMWYTLNDCFGDEPSSDSANWVEIEISVQVAYGVEIPTLLESGGLWMHLQEDGHIIMKVKTVDGYTVVHPEALATHVYDVNGMSLQDYLYMDTLSRTDINKKMTMQDNINGSTTYTTVATLKDNPNIIVCKNVFEDKLDVDGTCLTTFTVYDNTGIYVVRKIVITTTSAEDGSFNDIPEIII